MASTLYCVPCGGWPCTVELDSVRHVCYFTVLLQSHIHCISCRLNTQHTYILTNTTLYFIYFTVVDMSSRLM